MEKISLGRTDLPLEIILEYLDSLARLQQFDGSFLLNDSFLKLLQFATESDSRSSLSLAKLSTNELHNDLVVATLLAIRFMHAKLANLKDAWETMAEKAAEWLEGEIGEE